MMTNRNKERRWKVGVSLCQRLKGSGSDCKGLWLILPAGALRLLDPDTIGRLSKVILRASFCLEDTEG